MTPKAEDETADETGSSPDVPRARAQNVVAALVPLAVGVVAAVMSWNLGVGTLPAPGPGLWPLLVSVVMVVLAALLVLRSRPRGDEEPFTKDVVTVAVAVVSLLCYAFLFELIGFEVPTLALLVLWMKGLGREGWRVTAAVSVVATAALYLLFITGLGVSLPHLIHL
ncbi:tripartite tricarboxylate transporter TctB family protein [Actinomadura rugatobispora]|uniref:Tripartite tricarboxylate transporter TctB family protein n=1 Tax=Actinomadura rugatobispora TaxID=1994 RepID=A0ABW1AA44_9ACTN|nr:tripartite tricarboxylate transporter TctB family protein [Actinomadura rugatobispora]